jgi:glucose/arabinose dehydrogenase
MTDRPGSRAAHALLPLLLAATLAAPATAAPQLDRLQVPRGFTVELVSDEIVNARQLALAPDGTLYAGTRGDGRVWALRDGRVFELASGLRLPTGIALKDGDLYVASVSTILRLDDVGDRLADPPEPVVVTDALPSDGHHGWKHLEFGPEGDLWVPVGAPCNICDEGDPYATLLRMDPASGDYTVFARGIRNTVGFDFHPDTGELWFTDNGRDWMGDDVPPCELNHAPRAGMHFGYPHVHGDDVLDPEFGDGADPADYAAPALEMQAHTAPLGMAFYRAPDAVNAFPAEYDGAAFIAQHGSWNRSSKVGYQVIVAWIEDGEVVRSEPFLTGFLQGENAWGRPVDVVVDHDGSLLVSDDAAGAVYRIRWTGETVAGR